MYMAASENSYGAGPYGQGGQGRLQLLEFEQKPVCHLVDIEYQRVRWNLGATIVVQRLQADEHRHARLVTARKQVMPQPR